MRKSSTIYLYPSYADLQPSGLSKQLRWVDTGTNQSCFSIRGQAMVTLLIFMIIALTMTLAATSIVIVNSLSAQAVDQANVAYMVAESGIENALLRLLRDPNYAGETLTVGTGTAAVTAVGGQAKTITSKGTVGNFSRTLQVTATYNNYILTVTSWKEIF